MLNELKLKDVLSALLKKNHLSGYELSNNLSLPRTTIHKIITGKTLDPRRSTLEKISNYFGITVDELLGNNYIKPKVNQGGTINSIPKFKLNTLSNIDINGKLDQTEMNTLDVVSDSLPKNAIVVELTDNSMSPHFTVGTLLIIDPNLSPKNRNFVIAKINESQCVVFRQLIIKDKKYYLKPTNTTLFKEIQLSNSDSILGVLIETRQQF